MPPRLRPVPPRGPWLVTTPGYLALYAVLGEPFLDRAVAHYDGCLSVRVPGFGRCVLVTDPALVEQVVRAGPDELDPAEANKIISVIDGQNAVAMLSGTHHRKLRKTMLPSFKGHSLRGFVEVIAAGAERTLDRLPLDEPVRLLPALHVGALEVILEVVLGIDDPERLAVWGPAFKRLLELATSEQMTVRYMARNLGGLRFWGALQGALRDCDRLVYDELARRRDEQAGEGSDMLSRLAVATTEDGRALTDVEIRDNIVGLLVAGHETTATAVAWAIHWTLRDPEVLARLVEEAVADDGMDYATAIAREAVRLCPPFAGMVRQTVVPFPLGDAVVPVGAKIIIPFRQLQRDPALYDEPEEFRPERFLGAAPPPVSSFLAFGAGAHRCLGDHFAILEMAVFLHVFFRRGTFEPVDPGPEAVRRRSLVNLPADGCAVRLTSRTGR